MGRIERVNEQIKREIGQILLQELADPRLQFVTITSVDASLDLRHAKVYYSVLGDEKQIGKAQECLNHAQGMIRRLVGQKIKIRYTPQLMFIYDKTMAISAKIEETLQEIHNESRENHPDN